MLKLNFQPPLAVFLREMYSVRVTEGKMSLFVVLGEETSEAQNLGKGSLCCPGMNVMTREKAFCAFL